LFNLLFLNVKCCLNVIPGHLKTEKLKEILQNYRLVNLRKYFFPLNIFKFKKINSLIDFAFLNNVNLLYKINFKEYTEILTLTLNFGKINAEKTFLLPD